ncbi:MAG: GFA family protein [Rhodospirillales bacterium]
MSPPDHATGSCLCGAVTFEAKGVPLWTSHCHCRSCRRNTGAAVATLVGYTLDQATWKDVRTMYESSPGVLRGFCGSCGSPLSYEGEMCPGEVHIHISIFDEPDAFRPQRHVFFTQKIRWFDVHDRLPRHAGYSTDDAGAMSVAPSTD